MATEPRKDLRTQWTDGEMGTQKEGGGCETFRAVVEVLSPKQGMGGRN